MLKSVSDTACAAAPAVAKLGFDLTAEAILPLLPGAGPALPDRF